MKPSLANPPFGKFILFTASFLGMAISSDAQNSNQPIHSGGEIFVNNHRAGASNGCTTGFGMKGEVTCGHPNHVSKMGWSFLRSTAEGDIYRFTRRYPSGTEGAGVEIKEVSYSGKTMILWQDDYQKIVLRPRPEPLEAGKEVDPAPQQSAPHPERPLR